MDTSNTVSDLQILAAVGQAAKDTAMAACHDTSAILQQQAGTNIANMAANERLTIALDDSISKTSLANRESVERNGSESRNATNNAAIAQALAIERTGANNVSAVERNSGYLMKSVEKNAGKIQTAQEKIAGETRNILGTNNTAAALLGKDIQLDISETTGKLSLQASQNVGKVELDINKVKAHLEFQASENTAALQLEAVKNKSSLSAQLAECCCELKQIVASSAQETQKVLQEIENNRVRDALAAANTENLIARMTPRV
jgi:hypothetical protein